MILCEAKYLVGIVFKFVLLLVLRVLFQLVASHYDQKIEHMHEIAVVLVKGK